MSGYTIKNLREDVEDRAAERPGFEARMGRKLLESEQLGVSFFRFDAGVRSPSGHHHEVQEEAYVVVGGSGRMRLDDDIVELSLWDVVRVAPAVVRGFEGGPEGIEIIAIGGPRPEEGDGAMVSDWWVD